MVEELRRKIKVLNESIWENRAVWPAVASWLENFVGQTATQEVEQLHALYMLSNFMYFGARETRALLRALFRDAYRYPIIEAIRRNSQDTLDEPFIKREFSRELSTTRFLGVGNPAESGTHLLYYFRQENGLPKDLFMNTHEIFISTVDGQRQLRNAGITRYVFIDDLCGSGQQAQEYSRDVVSELKRLNPTASVAYYVLFANTDALTTIRGTTQFDDVNCIFDLDPSFKCFGEQSRYFAEDSADISKETARALSLHYGSQIWSEHPLGYEDCQLLVGFHHNTPDNTLPIIWFDEPDCAWVPIFKRYPKIAWW